MRYKLLHNQIKAPRGSVLIALYFKATQKITNNYMVEIRAHQTDDQDPEFSKKVTTRHIAGDWVYPTHLWPVGKIVQDWTYFRTKMKPRGTVDFYADQTPIL